METKYLVSFKLLDRRIGELDVSGLSEFIVDPRGQGVGRKALHFIEAMADPKPVVGFADDDTVMFYASCDWFIGNVIGGKHLVASEPIDASKLEGDIW